MLNKVPKVILIIEDSSSYCRSLIRGISRYSKLHGPWTIYRDIHNSSYEQGSELRKEFYSKLQNVEADGLITRNIKISKEVISKGVPTIVAITEQNLPEHTPRLDIDHIEVGKTAAEYFLTKGYKGYAFYGNTKYNWTKKRLQGFSEVITKAGYSVNCYNHPANNVFIQKGYGYKIKHLSKWLKSLDKPTAMLACSDAWAVNVIEAAKMSNIHIPEQLALLGVDNDQPICETCFPTLSSVMLNGEKGGFKIAEILDKLMKGQKPDGQTVLVEPVGVEVRSSTDVIAVRDQDIARAIQFIRSNKRQPLQITEVADHIGVSLRNLQNKFRSELDRTILDEIKEVRIDYAKELLLDTEMNISQISDYMSFSGINGFSRYFKSQAGKSPLEYRKKYGRF